jgi:riboflavin-specific deaminase-like protein
VRRFVPSAGPTTLDGVYADLRLAVGPADGERAGVSLGMVASADGAVTVAGRSGGLGGAADRVAFRRLRDACDAVLVGAGTVRAEGYGPPDPGGERSAARVASGLAPAPQLLVVTSRADLDPTARLFTAERDGSVPRPIVITHASAPEDAVAALREVAEVVALGTREVDLAEVLRWCAARGLRRVLCEGGPALNGSLLAAGLVDEVFLTVAPLLVAGDAGRIVTSRVGIAPVDLDLVELHEHAGELLLRYRIAAG